MKLTNKLATSSLVVLAIVLGPVSSLRADMGSIWVSNVGSTSLRVEWSAPSGIHSIPESGAVYRIYVEEVGPYTYTYPSLSREPKFSSKMFIDLTGLKAGVEYRVSVEGTAQVQAMSGTVINPDFRLVGTIRQRTLETPPGHVMRVQSTGDGSISIELAPLEAEAFDSVYIAYKRAWSSIALNETAKDPNGPAISWGAPRDSNAERGWVKLAPSALLTATFSGLLSNQAYEIAAYGHNVGALEGVKLGQVTGETAGYTPVCTAAKWLAAYRPAVLQEYGRRIKELNSGRHVIDVVADLDPSLLEDKGFFFNDETVDLNDTLTVMLFLIAVREDTFNRWQEYEAGRGTDLETYLERERTDIFQQFLVEKDFCPQIFHRGDANGRDGVADISDSVFVLAFKFLGGSEPRCLDAADANDDGAVDMSDAVFLLTFLFSGTKAPPSPAPGELCGADLTEDTIGCEEYHICSPST